MKLTQEELNILQTKEEELNKQDSLTRSDIVQGLIDEAIRQAKEGTNKMKTKLFRCAGRKGCPNYMKKGNVFNFTGCSFSGTKKATVDVQVRSSNCKELITRIRKNLKEVRRTR